MFKKAVVAFCLTVVAHITYSAATNRDAHATNLDPYSDLQARYKQYWSSMYLMFNTLKNMKSNLNDPAKYKDTIKEHPKAYIDRFKDFLANNLYKKDAHGDLTYLSSLSFLQLNLANWEAGYKFNTDDGPQISTLPWVTEEVKEISLYADKFRSSIDANSKKIEEMSKGKLSIMQSWDTIHKAKADPYFPNEGLASMLSAFYKHVDKNAGALEAIKMKDPKVFDAIKSFQLRTRDEIQKMDESRKDNDINHFIELQNAMSPPRIKRATQAETGVNQLFLDAFFHANDSKGHRPALDTVPRNPLLDPEKKGPIYQFFPMRDR